LPKVRKCDQCYERQSKGRPTACTEACPTGATICGERDTLVAQARERIAAKPDQYYNRIYGLNEVGGTTVLMLSAVPFEQIGLRTNLPQEPLPMLTWNVLSHVPDIVSIGSVLLGGIWWITNRREEVARAERGHK
jgi:formate dehydrogenase iron-sulfur subunit